MTSRNAGSVRTRTVGSALYNMSVQMSNIISSQVWQPSSSKTLPHSLLIFAVGILLFASCPKSWRTEADTIQIYRTEDQPLYRKGNLGLIILVAYNMVIIVAAKLYYKYRNHSRDLIWDSMTSEEKAHYLQTTEDKGNKRCVLALNSCKL